MFPLKVDVFIKGLFSLSLSLSVGQDGIQRGDFKLPSIPTKASFGCLHIDRSADSMDLFAFNIRHPFSQDGFTDDECQTAAFENWKDIERIVSSTSTSIPRGIEQFEIERGGEKNQERKKNNLSSRLLYVRLQRFTHSMTIWR